MKQNVLYLVIDSFYSGIIENDHNFKKIAPFLYDMINKNGICLKNVISQGPFTETGIKALITGTKSLDFGGYLNKGRNCPSNLFKVFKEKDYKTYVMHPNIFLSAKFFEHIDFLIASNPYLFNSVCGYKIDYLEGLIRSGKYDERDSDTFIEILDDCFEGWLAYLSRDTDKTLIAEYMSGNCEEEFVIVSEEYKKFELNKKKYAKYLIENYHVSPLYNLKSFDVSLFTKNAFYSRDIERKIKAVIRKTKKINLIDNPFVYNFVSDRSSKLLKDIKQGLGYKWYNSYAVQNELDTLGSKMPEQFLVSTKKQLDYTLEIINRKTPVGVKRMFFCHIQEMHPNSVYTSYDVNDDKLNQKEYEEALILCDWLVKNKKSGKYNYYLSLHYIDNKLKEFYSELDNHDDLTTIIVSDHGSHELKYPIRKEQVHSMKLENYLTPFIALNCGVSSGMNRLMYSQDDLLKIIHKDFKNIEEFSKEIAHAEYMGAGYADIRRRKIRFKCIYESIAINIDLQFDEMATFNKIVSIYNITEDKLEMINLKKNGKIKASDIRVCAILSYLNVRLKQIEKKLEETHGKK